MQSSLTGHALGPAARSAVTEARHLTLGVPSIRGVPAGQATLIREAAEQASLHAFHTGMLIAAVPLAVGGVVGVIGIRNPRGKLTAQQCADGNLLGDRAQLHLPRAAPATVESS